MAVNLHGFGALKVIDHKVIDAQDLEARNTLSNPMTIKPVAGSGAVVEGHTLSAKLPPYSYQMIRLGELARVKGSPGLRSYRDRV